MEVASPRCAVYAKTDDMLAASCTSSCADRHNDLLCIPIYWDAPVEVSAIAYEINFLESCRLLVAAASRTTAGRLEVVNAEFCRDCRLVIRTYLC